ncbi:MAG: 50S ribosomal protein L11 methyltransferase, partial [Acetanaerobacterium sp.]
MNFTKVKITTTSSGAEVVTGALMCLGITGFEIEDAQDFERFLSENSPRWDYVDDTLMSLRNIKTSVSVYLADNAQGRDMLADVQAALGALHAQDEEGALGSLSAELCGVREEDWANNWKQYFKPIEVGERFIICPSWEECRNEDGRIVLEIDPSSSFGTGGHHTTQLCIGQLERLVHPGAQVLDMGCGSGILSAAALLLGAAHVTAVDIDEGAVNTARDNVRKNGFEDDRLTALCGNVLEDEGLADRLRGKRYDVIVANIVADVIIPMGGLLESLLLGDGTLICSGILAQ